MIASTSTATMLRSGVARSSGWLQPSLLRTVATTTCPYSTLPTPSPSFSVRSKLPTGAFTTKPSPLLVLCAGRTSSALPARRHASSTPSSSSSRDHDLDAAAAARAAKRAESTAATNPDMPPLDWNTFFQLRKTRRRWQVACSVVLSLASGTGGAILLSTGVADSLTSQIPLDPFLTLGLMTLGFIGLGWLAGPSLGNTVFYLLKRKYKLPMTVKESQFFARVKKNRVDPSNSSTGNPVPDFYGEKISSVSGYRQWLKDQRAYNKKRTTFI
ncbi:mitochondrial import protein Pam17-domain-containing protein [Coniella lustricola]|uniref:Presequence translocated-associated motor subunit PAM17 n=1 Tax=Coniella lustricola TaxID=2025994 RepID=A0A2T3ADA4_9PEZI|nr:mitochondrial import protein Pam17-domain-containing protein [Coniella lustricola]